MLLYAQQVQQGKPVAARTHRPEENDVAALRASLGMTQIEFAQKFCISLGTLGHFIRCSSATRIDFV